MERLRQAPTGQRVSWADLQSELLSFIVSKYTTAAKNYVFLRHVCRGWRRSLTDYSPTPPLPSPQLPFLLLLPRIISPPSPLGKVFPLPFLNPFHPPTSFSLPQLQNTLGCTCVGSSHGWLIILGLDSSVSLLNPVTADSLPLGPLSSIDDAILSFKPDTHLQYHLVQKDIWHNQLTLVHRAILSSDPAKDCNFTVLLFLSGLTDCCFTWSGTGDTWSPHVHQPLLVEDVVFINGFCIAIDQSITLGFFNFRNHDTGPVVKLCHNKVEKPPGIGKAFLVNSDNDLLLVTTCPLHDLNPPFIPRGYIHVYGFILGVEGDDYYLRAQEIKTLRRHALFVGHGCSVSVSVRHFPWLIEDTVYFTHVYSKFEGAALYHGAVYRSIVTARSRPASTKAFDVENSEDATLWSGQRPFWVSPNLNRR